MRRCPICQADLETKKYKGVSVDECAENHGMFFDRGELQLAAASKDPDLRWLDFELFKFKDVKGSESDRKCPKCHTNMHDVRFEDSGVIVSTCPSCHGIWLDNKEFEKVVRSLESFVEGLSSQELTDAAGEELAEILTGPKGVSGEMKDFFAVSNLLETRYASEHPTLGKLIEVYYKYTPFR